jgi:hypothetical protein
MPQRVDPALFFDPYRLPKPPLAMKTSFLARVDVVSPISAA